MSWVLDHNRSDQIHTERKLDEDALRQTTEIIISHWIINTFWCGLLQTADSYDPRCFYTSKLSPFMLKYLIKIVKVLLVVIMVKQLFNAVLYIDPTVLYLYWRWHWYVCSRQQWQSVRSLNVYVFLLWCRITGLPHFNDGKIQKTCLSSTSESILGFSFKNVYAKSGFEPLSPVMWTKELLQHVAPQYQTWLMRLCRNLMTIQKLPQV